MRKLFILGVSSLFLGSPAMSATYSVDGFSTGNEGEASSGDAPRSVSGGGNAAGFGGSFPRPPRTSAAGLSPLPRARGSAMSIATLFLETRTAS
jgi:hypothetical protein